MLVPKDEQFSLPKLEEKVLAKWRAEKTFEKSLAKGSQKKKFVFYEGPPYANGRPGIHHVLVRAFKDIILRYKTMQGFYVPRRAGWDTHGLPTELDVEKQLGIKSKKEIEKFGVALFNQKARETAWGYKEEWERLTERIAYWLDLKKAYITYTNDYIETLWWIFRRAHERKFLGENLKVVPYCPRCETALASHELGMPGVYKKVKDPSVYIKFPLTTARVSNNKKGEKSFLLVWTTTPWTLPANLFVAVNPKLTYTKYRVGNENLWSYNPPPLAEGVEAEAIEKVSGHKLVGREYQPLYPISHKLSAISYKVIASDEVSAEDGTGLLHVAPGFGEVDYAMVSELWSDMTAIPVTVDDQGKMTKGFPGAGTYVKKADEDIKKDLAKRKLLYHATTLEHEYPHCWRCSSALLYQARKSWFFEMSRLRAELQKRNKTINWIPAHLKEGRFGEWIKDAKDWAISRDRYWGTPLPIWRCEKCANIHVAGSFDDLDSRAYFKNEFYFIRHTESEHNKLGVIAGGPEKGKHISKPTAKGLADAKKIAEKLKNQKFAVIYSSPYYRTKTLAKLISKTTKAKVVIDKRLGEINSGVFNWRLMKEHKAFAGTTMEEFIKTPPGGENLTDVRRRMFGFLREINQKHRGKKILIVSHGDPLWMLEASAKGASNEEAPKIGYPGLGEFRKFEFPNTPRTDTGELDAHKPYIDSIILACDCGGKMKRVKAVADVWFDSGAMPFAQNHFPFEKGQLSKVNGQLSGIPYPADYICEAIDQTRGWFYTLLAVATLLGYDAPYKNVLTTGLVMDKQGQKMSKSKGNVVNPWEIIEKYGADAVRWYFYTVNPPEEPKNFDELEIAKAYRRFHMMFWNSLVFFETYAVKSSKKQVVSSKGGASLLDQWVVARLNQTTEDATKKLEAYAIRDAALVLEAFVDDLSRWYIRRSRRRFQRPVSAADHESASATLRYVLQELAKLTAPFTPFFSEAIHERLGGKGSIHLGEWAKAKKLNEKEKKLIEGMAEVRRMASAGLAKRAEAGIKVRQPLLELRIKNKELKGEEELLAILAEEVNVKKVTVDEKLKDEAVLDTVITPELKEEGALRDVARAVQELRQKADLKPKDRIVVSFETADGIVRGILERNEAFFKKEVGAKGVEYKKSAKFNAEETIKIDGVEVWCAVRKT